MGNRKLASPAVPLPQPVSGALARNETLAGLALRMAESRDRLATIAPGLPTGLSREIRGGPIDDEGWTLLVSNAAVAAKLRHLLPHLQDVLKSEGWRDLPIRVHVRAR
jgi:hypothetical protein